MATTNYSSIDKYIVTAICETPLHIGSAVGGKEEVLIHPVDEKPFIQSSSIAGIMRSISEKVNASSSGITDRLFGYKKLKKGSNAIDFVGNLRISDGRFEAGSVVMELRPRVNINPETGSVSRKNTKGSDTVSGQKFDTESIGAGAKFSFTVYLYDTSLKENLENIFGQMTTAKLQLGGQKSNGNGYYKLISLKHKHFNMKEDKDRLLWADEENLADNTYTEIVGTLKKQTAIFHYEFLVKGMTDGELLVKGNAVTRYGKDAPDSMNMKNASDRFIVPGSALKGVLRNRMTYIAEQLKKKELIDQSFGYTGKNDDTGRAGLLSVQDIIFDNDTDNKKEVNTSMQHRIHIDKLTAGIISGNLFSQENIAGDVEMFINIRDCINKKDADATAGLLILALRDLASGLYNLGSGYNIGKGFIDVESVTITSADSSCEIDFKNNLIKDEHGIINNCLQALKNWTI